MQREKRANYSVTTSRRAYAYNVCICYTHYGNVSCLISRQRASRRKGRKEKKGTSDILIRADDNRAKRRNIWANYAKLHTHVLYTHLCTEYASVPASTSQRSNVIMPTDECNLGRPKYTHVTLHTHTLIYYDYVLFDTTNARRPHLEPPPFHSDARPTKTK